MARSKILPLDHPDTLAKLRDARPTYLLYSGDEGRIEVHAHLDDETITYVCQRQMPFALPMIRASRLGAPRAVRTLDEAVAFLMEKE